MSKVNCLSCDCEAVVKTNKRGKFYLVCTSCGLLSYQTKNGQELLENLINQKEEKKDENGNSDISINDNVVNSDSNTTTGSVETIEKNSEEGAMGLWIVGGTICGTIMALFINAKQQ